MNPIVETTDAGKQFLVAAILVAVWFAGELYPQRGAPCSRP
jgi:hypothetical protein